MRKASLLLTLFLLLTLISCERKVDNRKLIPAFVSGRINANKSLVLRPMEGFTGNNIPVQAYYPEIKSGDFLVLELAFHSQNWEEIMDENYVERIWIEIDPNLDSISIRDTQFKNYKDVWMETCFSPECNQGFPISSGYLKGKKLDNKSWWFEVEVGMISFQDTIFVDKETRKEI